MKKSEKKEIELKARDRQRSVAELIRNGHKKPVTRRDFIGLGLMASSSYVLAPSLLSLISERVYADNLVCPTTTGAASTMAPFFVIDLAGGAPLGQDFMVGGRGGQTDLIPGKGGDNSTAYDQYAIPNGLNYYTVQPDTSLGIRFHRDSTFLAGIKTGLGADAAAMAPSIDGTVILSALNSDTNTNTTNPIHYLDVLGRNGVLLPTIGTNASTSGGNSMPALGSQRAQTLPVRVNSQNDANGVLIGGNLASLLGTAKAQKIRDVVASMAPSKIAAFNNLAINEQITTLISCGYLKAADVPNIYDGSTFFTGANATNLTTAFGSTTSAPAVISRMLFSGAAGAATIQLGGYDDHNNTARRMRVRNQEAGNLAGRILRYAKLNNSPVVVAIITDGGMGISPIDTSGTTETASDGAIISDGGFFSHPGDNDSTCTLAMLSYVPGKQRGDLIQNVGRQIGSATPDGVDRNDLITATNPTNVAQAMMLNYLALHGMENQITKINSAGTNPFGTALERYLIFKKAIG